MAAFIADCGLALGAAVLLVTGVFHGRDLGGFATILRQQRLVPRSLTPAAARTVAGLELAVGAAAVIALISGASRLAVGALAGCLVLGVGFLVYLRSLMRSGHDGDCGCTPLASRLTPASFAPAGLLAAFGGLGLAGQAARLVGSPLPVSGLPAWTEGVPIAWGLTLAAVAMLLPASAPGSAERVRPASPVHGGSGS